jgi:hypothetical protein
MHLVNSMKLLTVPAGVSVSRLSITARVPLFTSIVWWMQQYMTHKGADADALFVILRGEAQECVRLTINEGAEIRCGLPSLAVS